MSRRPTGEVVPPYLLSIRKTGTGIEVSAIGYRGRERVAWIDYWGASGGWVAQEMTDSSGAIIAEDLPTREDAIDAVCDFVRHRGGTARIDYRPHMAADGEPK